MDSPIFIDTHIGSLGAGGVGGVGGVAFETRVKDHY